MISRLWPTALVGKRNARVVSSLDVFVSVEGALSMLTFSALPRRARAVRAGEPDGLEFGGLPIVQTYRAWVPHAHSSSSC